MRKAVVSIALLVAATPAAAQWQFAREADPITDAIKITATLQAPAGILQVGCEDGRRFMLVGSQRYLGNRPVMRSITIRFDSAPPIQRMWGHTGNIAVAMNDAGDLVAEVGRARRVAIRASVTTGGFSDMVFDLAGSGAQVARLDRECSQAGM